MLKKILSGRSIWKIVSTVGGLLTIVGGACTFIADPKNSEEEYRKIAKEEVENALKASNEES